MQELVIYLTQFVLAYLILGCALVLAIAFFIRVVPLNAASRHRIWLAGLLVLTLAPALSFYPEQSAVVLQGGDLVVNAKVSVESAQGSRMQLGESGRQPVVQEVTQFTVPTTEENVSAHRGATVEEPAPLARLSATFTAVPVYIELLALIGVLYFIGVSLKALSYLRSLRSLKRLLRASEPVSGDWQSLLEASANRMNIDRHISLRQSDQLSTPSTCGILRPCIIVPASMIANEAYSASRAQVLEHELAHVKRHDLLVAWFQSVVSIFLFWHPAVNIVNAQIRHERELACDDWVVNSNTDEGKAAVTAYAYGMISIAESMQSRKASAQTLACVNNAKELRKRIECLFDGNVDHSTSINLTPTTLSAAVLIAFLLLAADLFPQLPETLFEQKQGPGQAETERKVIQEQGAVLWSTRASQPLSSAETASEPLNRRLLDYESPSQLDNLVLSPEHTSSEIHSVRRTGFTEPKANMNNLTVSAEAPHPEIQAFFKASTSGLVHELVSDSSPRASLPSDFIYIDSLSRSQLRAEMRKIELELYRVFNQVTNREELRIHCADVMPLGSFIKQLSCEPEFWRTARSESLGDAIAHSSGALLPNWQEIDRGLDVEELAGQLVKEMESNEYLRELYRVLVDLKARYSELA